MAHPTWNQLCSNTRAFLHTGTSFLSSLTTDYRSATTICAALTPQSFVTPILEIAIAFSVALGHELYVCWKPRTSMASACSSVSHYRLIFS